MPSDNPQSLPAIASKYETRVTIFTPATNNVERIVEANPQRFYLFIDVVNLGAFSSNIIPGPVPDGFSTGASPTLPYIVKFRDCPSVCTGEFYAAMGLGGQCVIVECIYLGR